MPQKGPLSAPTDDQTGHEGAPANTATEVGEVTEDVTGEATAQDTTDVTTDVTADVTGELTTDVIGEVTEVAKVTKELAHRTRESDVFPAEWSRLSDTRFLVTAHWPPAHSFFGPVDDLHQDPMIVGETLRQTSLVLAHAEFGVPADTHFVMWDMEVFADPSGLLLADAVEPVAVEVVCSEIRRRGRGLHSMRTTMEFRRAGRLVARGTGSTGCTSPLAYRRLRARQLAALGTEVPLLPGVPPGLVGRSRAEDVVLASADRPGVWRLRVDTGHPILFPRPNDHVPGMVLFEAARQAATAASGGRPFLPCGMAATFSRYAELDTPCWIETEVLDETLNAVTVLVSGRQDGESVFTATLTSAQPAPVRSLS
jgi:hypothetical protein